MPIHSHDIVVLETDMRYVSILVPDYEAYPPGTFPASLSAPCDPVYVRLDRKGTAMVHLSITSHNGHDLSRTDLVDLLYTLAAKLPPTSSDIVVTKTSSHILVIHYKNTLYRAKPRGEVEQAVVINDVRTWELITREAIIALCISVAERILRENRV